MPNSTTHPTCMNVDLDALSDNLDEVRRRIGPDVKVIASLKANAYGHGALPIARRLCECGVEMLSTGSFRDAVAMRGAGIEAPILMFGTTLPSAIPEFVRHDLTPTVHNTEMADAVAKCGDRPVSVFIKVDCGFGRLGVPLRQAQRLVIGLAGRPGVDVAGLYTHLPFFDHEGCEWARERIARFDDLVILLARDGLTIPFTQARASAAIVAGIEDNCTAVCPGGILYGNSPVKGVGDASAFRPVMTSARTCLIHISPDAGDPAPGYEGIYTDRVEGATGVVPFGRNDGNRAAATGQSSYMLVDGIKAPIVGVSLEHCVLDLSAVDTPQIGDDVVILGGSGPDEITLPHIATWWGVGVNDVLMTFNGRMTQRFLGGSFVAR
jgi:alanine racemase